MAQKSASLTDLLMQFVTKCSSVTLSLYCPPKQYNNATL